MTTHEPISVIVLTKDEEENLRDCLDALLPQLEPDDETIIIDSASRDRTLEVARRYADEHPGRVRVHAYVENVTFGAARNRGIELARRDVIVMLSADANPAPGWAHAIRAALQRADIVYGRQRHAPPTQTAATVSRGLRYHHFEAPPAGLPERYASNVNAAYRRLVFQRIRFTQAAGGAEDVVLAREARLAGLRISYAPAALVHHKDIASFRAEWRKSVREGAAHAQLRRSLGSPTAHLSWLALLVICAGAAVQMRSGLFAWLALALLFVPTLRRLVSPAARRYRPLPLLAGALASPLFDLAFVLAYLSHRVKP
jgi:glycosyltransferase involved in cell wall biosynthesis